MGWLVIEGNKVTKVNNHGKPPQVLLEGGESVTGTRSWLRGKLQFPSTKTTLYFNPKRVVGYFKHNRKWYRFTAADLIQGMTDLQIEKHVFTFTDFVDNKGKSILDRNSYVK